MTDLRLVRQLKDRLAEALVMRHMKAIDLSKETDISRGAISQYLSGKVRPKQDKIAIMAQTLRVSPAWLSGFDVPIDPNSPTIEDRYDRRSRAMYDRARESSIRRRALVNIEVTLDERDLIEDFRLLPFTLKRSIIDIVEFAAYPDLAKSRFYSKAELKEKRELEEGLVIDEPDDFCPSDDSGDNL